MSAARLPRTVWAWALYDFANSAFTTLIVTFVYATFFTKAMAADEIAGTALWSRGVALTAVLVVLLSPFLGAVADRTGTRKRMLLATTVVCVLATAGLFLPAPGEALLALTLFVVANVAFEMSAVFYNAYLPEIAPPGRVGRVSGIGWGLGYGGGLLALVVALAVLVQPETPPFGLDKDSFEHVRAACLLVAGWYALFSVPAFLVLAEPPATNPARVTTVLRESAAALRQTVRDLQSYRQIVRLLVARLVYNDGLNTIFAFGAIYASGTFGFTTSQIILFGIVLNVAAGIGAVGLGFLDDRIGGKRTVMISIALLVAATIVAVLTPAAGGLWAAGILIGIAAGPCQSASRSLLARFVPPDKESEFFGFFAFTGKAAAFAGPLLFGAATVAFDSQRAGVATVLIAFALGAVLLMRVDEAAGVAASGRAAAPPDA